MASRQYRKQEAFSQQPPPPPQQKLKQTMQSPSVTSLNQQSAAVSAVDNKKISISDAIGLITIRLSKVESHLLKNKDNLGEGAQSSDGTNEMDTIVRNLVNRTNTLEQEHSEFKSFMMTQDECAPVMNEPASVNLLEISEFCTLSDRVSTLEQKPQVTMDPAIYERLDKNENDIQELKQMVLKLQGMLLETILSSKTKETTLSVSL